MKTVIGIDPDVTKSGCAIVIDGKVQGICTKDAAVLLEDLKEEIVNVHPNDQLVIVIEAGWKNASNWHLGTFCSARRAAKLGEAVGRCHEVGRILAKWCEYHSAGMDNVKVLTPKPLRKMWKGKDSKITAKELESITGYSERTNQEGRDACLLAWINR